MYRSLPGHRAHSSVSISRSPASQRGQKGTKMKKSLAAITIALATFTVSHDAAAQCAPKNWTSLGACIASCVPCGSVGEGACKAACAAHDWKKPPPPPKTHKCKDGRELPIGTPCPRVDPPKTHKCWNGAELPVGTDCPPKPPNTPNCGPNEVVSGNTCVCEVQIGCSAPCPAPCDESKGEFRNTAGECVVPPGKGGVAWTCTDGQLMNESGECVTPPPPPCDDATENHSAVMAAISGIGTWFWLLLLLIAAVLAETTTILYLLLKKRKNGSSPKQPPAGDGKPDEKAEEKADEPLPDTNVAAAPPAGGPPPNPFGS